MNRVRAGALLLPAALTVYLAFHSGGYFPGTTSLAAIVLALALLVRIVAAADPLAGLSRPVAVAAGALMLYGVWILASGEWSDSTSRALLEFNRLLVYLLALLLCGSIAHSVARLRWMVWGFAGAFFAVCLGGLLTRTLPDIFTIATAIQTERLSYPIGYWDALGLMAALGAVLCLHLATSEREPVVARIAGTTGLPALSVTLLFTFSRGALAVGCIGVVAYLLIGRPRAVVGGLLAVIPTTGLALVAAYRADLLASKEPTTQAAAAQGHDVALVVGLCMVAAAGLRAALLRLDDRLLRVELDRTTVHRLAGVAAAVLVVAGAGVLVGTGVPDRVDTQLDRLTRSDLKQTGDNRDRLTNPGINRLDHWEIALSGFEDAPLRGQGAGTFALLWDRDRTTDSNSEEGHSLYLEVMGELGAVGLALLVIAIVAMLWGVGRRARGPNGSLYAAVLTAGLVWVLHAGIDWDWEVAAVTLWLPALAAQAGATAPAWAPSTARPDPAGRGLRPLTRGLLALGCLGLVATPLLVGTSQAQLVESITAYERDDCATASRKADDSIAALGNRPEPFEVIGYCAARSGFFRPAEDAMRAAVERDPDNWEYRHGLALVRAAAGRDPRAAARRAVLLNPNEPAAQDAVMRFRRANDAQAWRSAAAELGLKVEPPGG